MLQQSRVAGTTEVSLFSLYLIQVRLQGQFSALQSSSGQAAEIYQSSVILRLPGFYPGRKVAPDSFNDITKGGTCSCRRPFAPIKKPGNLPKCSKEPACVARIYSLSI